MSELCWLCSPGLLALINTGSAAIGLILGMKIQELKKEIKEDTRRGYRND